MNIYVCIKQVPDTETKIAINTDQKSIATANVKWIVSAFDEIAVEEALRLKERLIKAGKPASVTVISAGPARCADAIRAALAMGAEMGVRIDVPENADANMTAKALAEFLKREAKVDIIFTGKESLDQAASQVSQLMAFKLKIPSVISVHSIEYFDERIVSKREIEGGVCEEIESPFPVLIAAQKGLNTPRYATLPNVLKAKKKDIRTISIQELGVSEADRRVQYTKLELPPSKASGKRLIGDQTEQAKELVKMLKNEAKVF